MRHKKPKGATDAHKMDFALTGTSTTTGWAAFEHRYDTEAQRQYWKDNRAEILRDWTELHPGSRPYGFWAFDAPENRQKLSDAGPDSEALREIGGTPFLGVPCHYSDPEEIEQDRPVFESEAAFLLRHNLMPKTEINRLKRADFEPETLKK